MFLGRANVWGNNVSLPAGTAGPILKWGGGLTRSLKGEVGAGVGAGWGDSLTQKFCFLWWLINDASRTAKCVKSCQLIPGGVPVYTHQSYAKGIKLFDLPLINNDVT